MEAAAEHRRGWPPPRATEILIIQPTGFCNIDCDYCYLPDRNKKGVLGHDKLARLLQNLRHDGVLKESLEILWHGGEPLAAGVAYYREATRIIQEVLGGHCTVSQTFQTNGVLLDRQWCALFKELGASIGLSVDGPREIHDRRRRTRSGGGTFDRVMRAIRLLQQSGLDFYAICVLSQDGLENPERIFQFAREAGIKRLCFNVEETEGINVSRAYHLRNVEDLARGFYAHALKEAGDADDGIWVREIYQMVRGIYASAFRQAESQVAQPFRIISVNASGFWSTYCPELVMSCRSQKFNDFKLGDLSESPISQHIDRSCFWKLDEEIAAGVAKCKAECEYFAVCGGGRPANKFCETGRFDCTETRQCRVTIKALADVCADTLSGLLRADAQVPASPLTATPEHGRSPH
jgi:uncharacterized protein